jgi:hypothetical protein
MSGPICRRGDVSHPPLHGRSRCFAKYIPSADFCPSSLGRSGPSPQVPTGKCEHVLLLLALGSLRKEKGILWRKGNGRSKHPEALKKPLSSNSRARRLGDFQDISLISKIENKEKNVKSGKRQTGPNQELREGLRFLKQQDRQVIILSSISSEGISETSEISVTMRTLALSIIFFSRKERGFIKLR